MNLNFHTSSLRFSFVSPNRSSRFEKEKTENKKKTIIKKRGWDARADNLSGGRLIPRIRGEIKEGAARETLPQKMIDCNEEFMQ